MRCYTQYSTVRIKKGGKNLPLIVDYWIFEEVFNHVFRNEFELIKQVFEFFEA